MPFNSWNILKYVELMNRPLKYKYIEKDTKDSSSILNKRVWSDKTFHSSRKFVVN